MDDRDTTAERLGMTGQITRRDFVNGALAGAGATLTACARAGGDATGPLAPSGSAWTGYGGVGDYAWSNGNTEAVVQAAHRFRDHEYPDVSARPIDERADLVVVGGGFSGMTVAYEFSKRAPAGRTCLLLDNHPVMGGEAKQNEFVVDGHRLTAPQGSNAGLLIKGPWANGSFDEGRYDVYAGYYEEFGLPRTLELETPTGGAERYDVPNYHFAPMAISTERDYATGYHFKGHGWTTNPIRDGFTGTPWPAAVRAELDDFVHDRRDVRPPAGDHDAWLDTISYHDLLDRAGYGAETKRFIDPYIAVADFGVCGNAISAYAAKLLSLPGTASKARPAPVATARPAPDIGVVSFPGGNAAILRTMLARTIPGAIPGDGRLAASATSPIDPSALDRLGASIRLRNGATVIDVRHEGIPGAAGHAIVTYARGGVIRKVRAKAVVMASGGWVNRNIVADMPDTFRAAYGKFHYGPILTANVALRNWRFFDKLGFINARWFEGLGWQVCVRRNVALNGASTFSPADPTVLTFYIPFLSPDLPAEAQGPAGRARLLGTSYAEFERQIRERMTEMFGVAGFDAKRDIAGIVLNRWGHAYCAPQPGFFLGGQGEPPPASILRGQHGRIVFAHSDLNGAMNMAYSMTEGHRAASQVLAMI